MNTALFQKTVWSHYAHHGRTMPWRDNVDPYWILVSEMMLQQTQVSRVIPKFAAFIEAFPTISELAAAETGDVLRLWSGLGYNRRARYLHSSAGVITAEHDGAVPSDRAQLEALPGIGPNTAGAILAYAYSQPVVYIETNIRTVYLHHFFHGQTGIDDKALLPLIENTLPRDRVREWYWALMDYGVFLKSSLPNPSRSSKHHTKQSTFEGSDRQVRGNIIRALTKHSMSIPELSAHINDPRFDHILRDLDKENLITIQNNTVKL